MSDPNIYTVGWICAIETELVAAASFLDEEHDDPEYLPVNDNNSYVLGRIGKHNVVIAALPDGQYGLVTAATVARDMVRSFPNVRIGLMVGIGGGAPSANHDVRLGDVVVSFPGPSSGGVFQYDYGKTVQDSKFVVTSHLNQPPQFILSAIATLKAQYKRRGHDIEYAIEDVLQNNPRLQRDYRKQDPSADRLYVSTYMHAGTKEQECAAVCDAAHLVVRPERSDEQDGPTIHYGTIASANQLMKDANLRDKLSAEHDILCVEMEAAGLMNQFPCLVIRGICDYSDTHKNNAWQGYAAMAAAAYAKDLLRRMAPNKVEAERKLVDIISHVDSKLGSILSQVQTTHAEIKSIQFDKHTNNIVQWLAPPDVFSNFNQAIKARHPGSGRRFLDSKAFKTWKNGDNPFLWLHGIPGCGKTILTSTVIDDLQRALNSSQTLLYFYFDYTDRERQSFENSLRSFVIQIYHQKRSVRKHLDSLYSSVCRDGEEQPSLDLLQRTFTELIGSLEDVWIVLDALDECTPRAELLAWLRNINQDLVVQTNMHLLVTSRPEHDIESAIRRYASNEQIMAIRNDLLEADIRNYVQARVREHEGLSRWRGHKEIQDEIEASLLEKANGMFRWVSCQLDVLEDCLERKALLKALQELPRTLDETYERILANIPSAHMHHTTRILQFLTYSERPLRLEEAVDAIAVDVGEDVARGYRFNPQNRLPVPEAITSFCPSLVVLVSRQGRYGEDQKVKEIQLAHFSVKDYLTSDRLESRTARYFQETSARSSIAEVCLSYLLDLPQRETAKQTREAFPFAQYAAQYWASYAVIGEQKSERMFKLAKKLFLDRALLENWRRLFDPDKPWQVEPKTTYAAPSLYYASLLGLSRCVRMLLDNEADVDAEGGECGNALQASSSKGHQEIVQFLVDKGADVNAQGGRFGNAFYAASYEGHQEIVQILVENGADVNAQGGYYGTALQAASDRGHQKTVQFLVDKGADVNAQGGEYGNALQAASHGGHQYVVQLLVDNGANVNARGGKYGNALYAASDGGYREIVQLLIDQGADVNAQGGEYGNALQAASYKGHYAIAQILVDNGADVNAQHEKYGNALYASSDEGYPEIVQLLIDKGADVNAQGGEYGNALYAASFRGHQRIVQLLIDKGAEVNTGGGKYGNALYAASDEGYPEIVQLLIDKGADVNAQGGEYGNALQAASYGGHQYVAQLLVDNGADVNAGGGKYGNALQAALAKGHEMIYRMLIDHSVNANTQGDGDHISISALEKQPGLAVAVHGGVDADQPNMLSSTLDVTGAPSQVTFRDSALGTSVAHESSKHAIDHENDAHPHNMASVEEVNDMLEQDTIYTQASNDSIGQNTYDYESELATRLHHELLPWATSQEDIARVSGSLPRLLQFFAFKIAKEGEGRDYRDTKRFMLKHRRLSCSIAWNPDLSQTNILLRSVAEKLAAKARESFKVSKNWSQASDSVIGVVEEVPELRKLPSMSYDEKVKGWNPPVGDITDPEISLASECGEAESEINSVAGIQDLEDEIWDIEGDGFSRLITESRAYQWLLVKLRNELKLGVPIESTIPKLSETMFRELNDQQHFSRQSKPRDIDAVFDTQWSPHSFFDEQEYGVPPEEAVVKALVLIGTTTQAEGMTCGEYLLRQWPESAPTFIRLIKSVVRSAEGTSHNETLSDNTTLRASVKDGRFELHVCGHPDSVIEVGEQFMWISCALKSSDFADVAACEPSFEKVTTNRSSSQVTMRIKIKATTKLDKLEKTDSGTCWHALFRNPLVVGGFPIPLLGCPDSANGLQLSMGTLLTLVADSRLVSYMGKLFVKRFSTLLVAVKREGNVIVWHVISNKDGSYIDYHDKRVSMLDIRVESSLLHEVNIYEQKHVIGWTRSADNVAGSQSQSTNSRDDAYALAGTSNCNHQIAVSGLRYKRIAEIELDRFTIGFSKYITASVPIALGFRDRPLNAPEEGDYMENIRHISNKFVVLYDVKDQRGFLIDGATALLYLVRVSLVEDEGDGLFSGKSDLIQSNSDLDLRRRSMGVLLSPENAKIKLHSGLNNSSIKVEMKEISENSHPQKTTKEIVRNNTEDWRCLKDRITDIWWMLHRAVAIPPEEKIKLRPRDFSGSKRLEGYEFWHLACTDQANLLFAEPKNNSKGWLDMIQKLNAATLFGSGFGDIIRHKHSVAGKPYMCPDWESVPKEKDYLAMSNSTLKRIIKVHGDADVSRLMNEAYHHGPEGPFGLCRQNCNRRHFLVSGHGQQALSRDLNLPEDGAIIIGHQPSGSSRPTNGPLATTASAGGPLSNIENGLRRRATQLRLWISKHKK